jgi:hypothetical protein
MKFCNYHNQDQVFKAKSAFQINLQGLMSIFLIKLQS